METYYRFQYRYRNQPALKKVEKRKIVELSKRLSTRATTSIRQIMQTLSTLPVSIVIHATRAHKRTTHQTQQKISRPYFVKRYIYFLRLTFFVYG